MIILTDIFHVLAGSFSYVAVGFMINVVIWSLVWVYVDAINRGKPGCSVALLVLLVAWPIGLLIWIVFRPEQIVNETEGRGLDPPDN